MIGLGKWQATVNALLFKGTVGVTISDNNGEYVIDFELPDKFKDVKVKTYDIKEEGNTLSGKGEITMLPGKELEAIVTFDGDTMTGVLNIPFMKKSIELKNGHRVVD